MLISENISKFEKRLRPRQPPTVKAATALDILSLVEFIFKTNEKQSEIEGDENLAYDVQIVSNFFCYHKVVTPL